MALDIFRCRAPMRRYPAELFLGDAVIRQFTDGYPIGNARSLLEREAARAGAGDFVEITAVALRGYTDIDGMCAALADSSGDFFGAPVPLPPPGPNDLEALAIAVRPIDRTAGIAPESFAVRRVRREAAKLRLPAEIWGETSDAVALRQSNPDEAPQVLVYYDPRQPERRRGRACFVRAPWGGLAGSILYAAYQRCMALLDLPLAPKPPSPSKIGEYVRLPDGRTIFCPGNDDCPVIEFDESVGADQVPVR